MIHLFLNGTAASAGGGLTYLRNLIPALAQRGGVRATVAVGGPLRQELGEIPNVSFMDLEFSSQPAVRFLQEQLLLPKRVSESGANVLVSTGNFALRRSPVPQILLSRNSLYTSRNFYGDLWSRRDYWLLFDTWLKGRLARKSIAWADRTVAPSESFAREVEAWAHREVVVIPHGFDPDAFFADSTPLKGPTRSLLASRDSTLRLLFVSHYNYYRNFETLLRAIPVLRSQLAPRKVEVVFTCKFRSDENPGAYRTEEVARLIEELKIASNVIELGAVPYGMLHHVYRACHVYVSPAYAESFAHPLVEAMSCGLPVVAADRPVHRETCGNAALYFACFSPEELAEAVVRASASPLREELLAAGSEQSKKYSWQAHVTQLLELAQELLEEKQPGKRATISQE